MTMYCVNCGVKLGDAEKSCPLCATAVFHPDLPHPQGEPLYPADRLPAPQVSSRGGQIILTALFLIPLLICLQCDLLVKGSITWSGYVAGALITAYVTFVLPRWFRKPNPAVFCPVTFLSVLVYLLYINFAVEGNWFLTFALPVTCGVGLIFTAVAVLLRYLRRGRLYIFGGALMALGLFMVLVEYLLCVTFEPIRFYGWSVYPLTVLLILGGMLIFLAVNRGAREKMEKRFFI
jgi:hypothetical protein